MGSDAPPKSGWARLVPEPHVTDLDKSLAFRRDCLAFRMTCARVEERFVYLEREEGAQIMLCERNGRFETGAMQRPLGQGAMLREVWRATGDRESGQRELFVQDPDGYLVMVAETIGERPSERRR